MSEFNKKFPDYEDMPEAEVLHRKYICEGWLAALKWVLSIGKEHGTIGAFNAMADEIEELEKE